MSSVPKMASLCSTILTLLRTCRERFPAEVARLPPTCPTDRFGDGYTRYGRAGISAEGLFRGRLAGAKKVELAESFRLLTPRITAGRGRRQNRLRSRDWDRLSWAVRR